jgi:hypothetical protein
MPLLGPAAMLLSFDVEAGAVAEHDQWHTQEHLPERLSTSGFLRGTRWVAVQGAPRYLVLYEVSGLEVLVSQPYLARLNHPTPWTARMMPHYRGMHRGLCTVLGSFGLGQGGVAALVRCTPAPGQAEPLKRWLLGEALPGAATAPGLASAHLLQGAQPAPMTDEQRIRGADRGVDTAIVVTGHDDEAVAAFAARLVGAGGLPDRGAVGVSVGRYRVAHALLAAELGA